MFSWSDAWAEQLARSSHTNRLRNSGISSEQFWDGFSNWRDLHSYTKYPGRALDYILQRIDPQCSVLDIGAGSGALTVPLAKSARLVTAIEPSMGQIARLKENAAKSGAYNIRIIQKRWEDVDLTELGTHDIVTAAYCFQMEYIKAALEKMYSATTRFLFLLHFVDHDLLEPLRRILGAFDTGPDYIYLYNVLHEMGYPASVEIFTRNYDIPLDFQLAVFEYSHGLSFEQKEKLRCYLESEDKICSNDGLLWVRRQYKDAVIRLEKEEKQQ